MVAVVILGAILILVLGVASSILMYKYVQLSDRVDELKTNLAITVVSVDLADQKAQRAWDQAVMGARSIASEAVLAAESKARSVAKEVARLETKEQEKRIHEEMGHFNRLLFTATSELRGFTDDIRKLDQHDAGTDASTDDDANSYTDPPCW